MGAIVFVVVGLFVAVALFVVAFSALLTSCVNCRHWRRITERNENV